MRCTYYISLSKETHVETYFARITGSDPKYGLKRTFFKAETHDCGEERAYYITIQDEGVYEQSIKIFLNETKKLIRRERKWFLYDGHCLHEIDRRDVLDYLSKIKEMAIL